MVERIKKKKLSPRGKDITIAIDVLHAGEVLPKSETCQIRQITRACIAPTVYRSTADAHGTRSSDWSSARVNNVTYLRSPFPDPPFYHRTEIRRPIPV